MLQFAVGHALSDAGFVVPAPSSTDVQPIVDTLNAHNQRMFRVAIISTLVLALGAFVNSYRTLKQLQHERK